MNLIFFGTGIIAMLAFMDEPDPKLLIAWGAFGMITFGVEYLLFAERLMKARTAPEEQGND